MRRSGVAIAAAIVVAAAIVRVLAANHGLWFDEIWSLRFAAGLDSPLGVFSIHHSNNSHLNTLWLWALGAEERTWPWVVYRLPAIVAGASSVLLAGRIARRRGPEAGWLAMVLTAASHPLIHYASEARGYGLALCFDLWAFDALERWLDRRRGFAALEFGVACVLSALAHPMFLMLYPALLLGSIVELRRRGGSDGAVVVPALALHGAPLVALLGFYLLDLRHMTLGGAPGYELRDVLRSTLSLAAGGPADGAAAAIFAGASAVLLAACLIWLALRRPSGAAFFALAIVVLPALALAVRRPPALFVRYFLGSLLVFLVLLAIAGAAAWKKGGATRTLAVVLLLAFVVGNGAQTARLIRIGRGDYLGALRFMSAATTGPRVVIGSDHDDRTRLLLGFYRRRVPPEPRVAYVDQRGQAATAPDWYIRNVLPGEPRPTETLTVRGRRYGLRYVARSVELSGWEWLVFRRE